MTRKSTYAMLLAIMCISLLTRYPRVPHGIGVDSYLFALLSASIVNQGRAAWLVHPLSPFGLYPLSYPSGSFFLTADLSLVADIKVEVSSLLLSNFVGVVGVLAGFLLGREVSRRDSVAITVAMLFSLMPKFVTNTLWEVPARGLLMLMTPLFLVAVLRAIRTRRMVDISLILVTSALMALFHRLAVVILIVFFAFLIALVFIVAAQVVRVRLPTMFMSPRFKRMSRRLNLVTYGGVLVLVLVTSGVLDAYQQGAYFSNESFWGPIGNLLISITRSVGFLSPLAVLGIAAIIKARNKSPAQYLFLTAPIALIPTLFLRDYTGYYLVTFFALFIGLGLSFLVMRIPRRLQLVSTCLLGAMVVSSAVFAINIELPHQTYMTDSEYTSALYARQHVTGTIASNDGLLGARVASVSQGPLLPIGGATTAQYGPDAMAFGFVTDFPVRPIPVWDLTIDSDSFFDPLGVTVGSDWSVLLSNHISGQTEAIATRYHITTLLEDTRQPATYYTGWGVQYDSPFLHDVYVTRYKTFETDSIRLWQIG